MKLDEFKNRYKKFKVQWGEEEVSRLARFSEIMKKSPIESTKYLLVSEDSIGFTDSYRAIIINAANVVEKIEEPIGYYSPDLLSVLKKAQEIALLADYTLAVLVKEEVSFFTGIFSEKEMPSADILAWRAICDSFRSNDLNLMCPQFHFTHEGISVKADLGKSHLEALFPIPLKLECEKVLDPRFIDLWLKATAKEKVVSTLLYTNKESSAVCFKIPNLTYIIMPISWRKGGK